MKPLEVLLYCLLRCHGSEKFGSECTQKIWKTHILSTFACEEATSNHQLCTRHASVDSRWQAPITVHPADAVEPDLDNTFHEHFSATSVTIKAVR